MFISKILLLQISQLRRIFIWLQDKLERLVLYRGHMLVLTQGEKGEGVKMFKTLSQMQPSVTLVKWCLCFIYILVFNQTLKLIKVTAQLTYFLNLNPHTYPKTTSVINVQKLCNRNVELVQKYYILKKLVLKIINVKGVGRPVFNYIILLVTEFTQPITIDIMMYGNEITCITLHYIIIKFHII